MKSSAGGGFRYFDSSSLVLELSFGDPGIGLFQSENTHIIDQIFLDAGAADLVYIGLVKSVDLRL